MTTFEWTVFAISTAAKASLVLALAFVITRFMRRSTPAARHLVWMLAAVSVLAIPLLSMVLPTWRVHAPGHVLRPAAEAVSVRGGLHIIAIPEVHPSRVDVHAGGGWRADEASPAPVVAPVAPARREVVPTPPAPVTIEVESTPPAPLRSPRRPLLSEPLRSELGLAVLLFWLAGSVVAGARLLRGLLRVRGLTRDARPLLDPALLVRAHGVAADLGLSRPVRLLESADDVMPVTFGFVRATLLLPASAREWSASRQTAVLRHELAHIRRRDSLTQLIAELACVLYWFNPLAWYGAWRMSIEREHACDDAVLATGSSATDYAAELLSIARTLRTRRAPAVAAIAMARPSNLHARLAAVLEPRPRQARASLRLMVPAWVGAFLLVTPLSSLGPDLDPRFGAEPAFVMPERLPARTSRPPTAEEVPVATASATGSAAPAPVIAVVVDAASPEDCLSRSRNTSVHHNANDHRQVIRWSGSRCSGEVTIEGDVRFDESFSRVTAISRGGMLRIQTKEDGVERRVTIRGGDRLTYEDYRVNNARRELDADGQAWIDNTILFLFRRMGWKADERANAMLARGGPQAVLAEVELLQGDYTRSRYIGALVESGSLDGALLRRTLDLTGRSIGSDHYRAEILKRAAGRNTFTPAVTDAYIGAVSMMGSDHYRHEAFTTVIDRGSLSPTQVAAVVRETGRIGSDHYRSSLLEHTARRYPTSAEVRQAYLDAVGGIGSDHYRSMAIERLIDGSDLRPADVVRMAAATEAMKSDHYRQQTLTKLARIENLDREALLAILDAADRIGSDHYRSVLLTDVAKRHALRGPVRTRFERVMADIRSSHYRGQVAAVLAAN